jgi:hypothetical protein
MKKRNPWAMLLLAVCTALLLWAYTQVRAVSGDLQYLIPAPPLNTESGGPNGVKTEPDPEPATAEPLPNAQAKALLEILQTVTEDWFGVFQNYTMSGVAERASLVSDADVTLQARLNALGKAAFTITPQYLRIGRLFYPEELSGGSDGILLDEQLALALFHVAEPIGRTVTINNESFTVIGVLRHAKRVGDAADYAAYVPLSALWDKAIQLDALQVTARLIAGAGARAIFKEELEAWQAGGTLIDLGKAGMGALLPLRVLLVFCGGMAFFRLLGYWIRRLRRFVGGYRDSLQAEYAQKLLPRLLAGIFLLALTGGALLACASALTAYLVAPVYTFPEWVPTVPVEWNDIQAAFWQVWQSAAGLRELRSPELLRLRYFAMVTAWCSAGAAVAFTNLWVRRRDQSPGEPIATRG